MSMRASAVGLVLAASASSALAQAAPEFDASTPVYGVVPSKGFPYGRGGVHNALLPKEEFAARRAAFFEELARLGPNTVAIVKSSPEFPRNGDEDYEYRPDSDFYWLTGFPEAEAVAFFETDAPTAKGEGLSDGKTASQPAASQPAGRRLYSLAVRPRDKRAETWTGKRIGPEGAVSDFGADAATLVKDVPALVKSLVRRNKTVVVVNNNDEKFRALVDKAVESARAEMKKEREQLGGAETDASKSEGEWPRVTDGRPWIHSKRLIKSPAEIEMMRKACEVSIEGHLAAMRATRPGINEGEIEAAAEFMFRGLGAPRLGYATIAGGGNNGCILHYGTNNESLGPNDLMLMDAAAEVGMYTADVTRTWPISGKFTPEQRALYEVVLRAQDAGIAAARAGVPFNNVHLAAAEEVTKGLVALGILQGDPAELTKKSAFRPYFMHGTSHWLGMDVHDAGSRAVDLAPGMILTVEPGIYIAAGSPGVDKKWWGIGIRIEDDILVTGEGPVNLTQRLPRDPDVIESVVRNGRAAAR